jgi:hypothetical protein
MGISTLAIINKDNVVIMNILDLILPCNEGVEKYDI